MRWPSEISDEGIVLQRSGKRIHDGRGDSCSWNLHDCCDFLLQSTCNSLANDSLRERKAGYHPDHGQCSQRGALFAATGGREYEVYIEERDLDLETIVVPLEEMETIDGNFLQNMWQVTVIARFEQDGQDQERVVRGWRYLPLYR